jgi:hypothetical protein
MERVRRRREKIKIVCTTTGGCGKLSEMKKRIREMSKGGKK